MKVTLLSYTPNAVDLLIFSKSTRLQMRPGLMKEISNWPQEKKMEELAYMARTIPSSWEFVEYVFIIEDVSRGFTHQFVRNRHGSYAQQTMRVLRVSNLNEPFKYVTGPTIASNPEIQAIYDSVMRTIDQGYNAMIDMGAKEEDARGVLPTNICTNIMAKFNMRTLSEMGFKRGTSRTQQEYRQVKQGMIDAILAVHPWASLFLIQDKKEVVKRLEELAKTAGNEGLYELSRDILKEAEFLHKEFSSNGA